MPDFGEVSTPVLWNQAALFVLMSMGSLVGAGVVLYLLVQYGDRLPVVKNLYLRRQLAGGKVMAEQVQKDIAAEGQATEERLDPNADLIGKRGEATTALRPSGKVRLDSGALIDVVTEGGALIDVGTRVRVLETKMNRIVVRPDVA